jgi:hypothetical protein
MILAINNTAHSPAKSVSNGIKAFCLLAKAILMTAIKPAPLKPPSKLVHIEQAKSQPELRSKKMIILLAAVGFAKISAWIKNYRQGHTSAPLILFDLYGYKFQTM